MAYSALIGSFERKTNQPIEAQYIFPTYEDLVNFYATNPEWKENLHKGLFKVVENDGEDNQVLYWVYPQDINDPDSELIFKPLISSHNVDDIYEQLQLEILNRIAADNEIRGDIDFDQFPTNLNNLLKIANALAQAQTDVSKLQSDLKAVVGTSEDDIIAYLQTLDYKSITELSDKLRDIIGGVTSDFDSLEKIEEFVRKLRIDVFQALTNQQTEINLTQTGVGLDSDGKYSPDLQTNYLKNATSVMNALKTLDALIRGLHEGDQIVETSSVRSVSIPMQLGTNGSTELHVKISNQDRIIEIAEDGLWANISIVKRGDPDDEFAAQYDFIGKNGDIIGTIDLLKDLFLKSVDYIIATQDDVDIDPTVIIGDPYFKFDFIISSGGDEIIYLPIKGVISITTGFGLKIVDGNIEVNPDEVVTYNVNDNVELKGDLILPEGGKIVGTDSSGEQHDIAGLGEYSETLNLTELPVGYDLKTKTIVFDTSRSVASQTLKGSLILGDIVLDSSGTYISGSNGGYLIINNSGIMVFYKVQPDGGMPNVTLWAPGPGTWLASEVSFDDGPENWNTTVTSNTLYVDGSINLPNWIWGDTTINSTLPQTEIGDFNNLMTFKGSDIRPYYETELSRKGVALLEDISPVGMDNVIYVAQESPVPVDEQDGTLSRPYTIIQDAVNAAEFGNVIQILPGEYIEDQIIIQSKNDLTIIGESSFGLNRVVIDGNISITDSERIGISNILIDGVFFIDHVSGTEESKLIYLDNVTIGGETVLNGLNGYMRFDRCFFNDFRHNPMYPGSFVDIRGCLFEGSSRLYVYGSMTMGITALFDTTGIHLVHYGGNVLFSGHCMFTSAEASVGKVIESTAGQAAGAIRLDGGTTLQPDGLFAGIDIPDCQVIISSNFIYDPQNAVISSFKMDGGGASSTDIYDYNVRTAIAVPDYDHSLKAWLDGIDDAIITLVRPTINVENSNGLTFLNLPTTDSQIISVVYNGLVLSSFKPLYVRNGTLVEIIDTDILNQWDSSNDLLEVTYML